MVLYMEWEAIAGSIDSMKIGDHVGGKQRVAEWWSLLQDDHTSSVKFYMHLTISVRVHIGSSLG